MKFSRHADYKPYTCDFEGCEKTFFDKYKMRQHAMTHDPDAAKNYVCQYCERPFAQLDYLNCHIRRKHSNFKPYSCKYCPKQFAFIHDLNLHLSNHTGNKKHVCHICDASFTKAWSLKQHMTLHEVNSTSLICNACGFAAPSKSQFRTHLLTHDCGSTSPVSFLCGECNAECKTEESLKNHLEEAHNHFSFIDANSSDQDPYSLGEIP